MGSLADCRHDIGEEETEDITNDQSAEDVGDEVNAPQQALAADSALQSQRNQQAEEIDQNGSDNCIFKCKPIGVPDTLITEQVDVIAESYEIIITIATVVGEAVDCTGNQRNGVECNK